MNWQDKIYESLITEKRSEASRRKTSLRKRGAEMEKRKASGKSIGAYGAGTRARTAKAQAEKASKPAMWHARRHYEGEAERLIAHGKSYKANQKAAKVAEAKGATAHSIDVFHKKLGNAGAGETKRGEAAIKASDESKERRDRRLKAVKFGKGQRILRHPVGSYKPKKKVAERSVYDPRPSNPKSATVGNKLPAHILKIMAAAKAVPKEPKKK